MTMYVNKLYQENFLEINNDVSSIARYQVTSITVSLDNGLRSFN